MSDDATHPTGDYKVIATLALALEAISDQFASMERERDWLRQQVKDYRAVIQRAVDAREPDWAIPELRDVLARYAESGHEQPPGI